MMNNKYIVGTSIELTDLEINMLKGYGFQFWDLEKMSKEELEEAHKWLEANMECQHSNSYYRFGLDPYCHYCGKSRFSRGGNK